MHKMYMYSVTFDPLVKKAVTELKPGRSHHGILAVCDVESYSVC